MQSWAHQHERQAAGLEADEAVVAEAVGERHRVVLRRVVASIAACSARA